MPVKPYTLSAFLLAIACASPFHLYRSPAEVRPALPAQQKSEERFEFAQQNIEDAIRNMEFYLKDNSKGRNADMARMQLAALLNLKASRVPPTPVPMATYQQKILWYVDKVVRTKEATRVTLKIANQSLDQDCAFRAFSTSPLVLIGEDRELYMMSKTPIQLPKAVRTSKYNILGNSTNEDYWMFQGGRTITLEVEFEPLPEGVLTGQIQYLKPVGGVTPVKFSLVNERQQPDKQDPPSDR